MRLRLAALAAILCGLLWAAPAAAHANLSRSSPPANSMLAEAPEEIRLWFTEPLEPDYSRITLLDMNGEEAAAEPSYVDSADAHQMVLRTGDLPDGVYTVSWRALSTADGHVTQGSFTFGVGMPAPSITAAAAIGEDAPIEAAAIRAFNLAALSLYVGSLGFRLFAWRPAWGQVSSENVQRRLYRLTWAGWLLVGVAQALMLVLQTAAAADIVTPEAVGGLLANSIFGTLWLVRTALWLLSGLMLWLSAERPRLLWAALCVSLGILFLHSQTSHAAAAPDALAAVANDTLHLLASCLWFGGLVAFALALARVEHTPAEVGSLVGWFSNYARVIVAALALTGVYAAWLHVGSLEALVNTVYGRALLVKLLLFLPLLAIAAVNLLLTRRALLRGERLWIGRLRGLIGVEVSLLAGVLLAVGMMTALNPARGVEAARAAAQAANSASAAPAPYFDMQSANNLMAHLEIVPGVVGENTFTVSLIDEGTGHVIEDASLIRLRFDSQAQDIGQSELRPQPQGNSTYSVTGSNLSLPGDWRIRMTVQRPGAFDSVIDFEASIPAAPTPPAVELDLSIPAVERGGAALLVGITLLVAGGFAFAQLRFQRMNALLAVLVGAVAVVSLFTGAQLLIASGGAVTAGNAWARPAAAGQNGAVYLTIDNPTADAVWLVDVTTSAAERVELHETIVQDEIARMESVPALTIAPGDTARIEPLGLHLMLMNLQRDLDEGMSFPLVLTFSTGTTLTVDVQVRMTAPE